MINELLCKCVVSKKLLANLLLPPKLMKFSRDGMTSKPLYPEANTLKKGQLIAISNSINRYSLYLDKLCKCFRKKKGKFVITVVSLFLRSGKS